MPVFLVPLHEHNDCHEPAGSAAGGQFCSRTEAGTDAADAEALIATARQEGNYVLFHSGDFSLDEDLAVLVEPQHGEWVDEVLAGATDDEELADQIRNEGTPAAFFSETPGWVSMKVARKIGKHVGDVTVEDVRKHGQLTIVIAEPHEEVWQADNQGRAFRLGSEGKREYLDELPFGIEGGDIFTTEAMSSAMTLTGPDLLRFLAQNYPTANLLKDPQNLQKYMQQLRFTFESRRR